MAKSAGKAVEARGAVFRVWEAGEARAVSCWVCRAGLGPDPVLGVVLSPQRGVFQSVVCLLDRVEPLIVARVARFVGMKLEREFFVAALDVFSRRQRRHAKNSVEVLGHVL